MIILAKKKSGRNGADKAMPPRAKPKTKLTLRKGSRHKFPHRPPNSAALRKLKAKLFAGLMGAGSASSYIEHASYLVPWHSSSWEPPAGNTMTRLKKADGSVSFTLMKKQDF